MKPEDRKRLKQHIEMIVEHKTPIEELQDANCKLRLELSTLRFKESQEQRFIWWVWNVYSRNVNDLILSIMGATTYDTEGEAKEGKYALPKHCFDLMKRIDEYTENIYDGTYLDVEISTDAKKGIPENKPAYNENAKYTDSLEYLKGCYDKPSPSDVSVTQDVLMDIKTPQSIENTNPDYYKDEIKVLLDDLIRDARDYEEALNIGRGISGAAYACNMSREKLRAWMTKAAVAMKSKDIVIDSRQKTINELAGKAFGSSKLKELSDRFYLLLVDNPETKLLADKIMSDVYGKD